MAKEKESLKKVQGNELLDLLENTGILQEANRTFFHPIGLNLKLEKDFSLALEISNTEFGVILHTVDKFKLKAFNEYRFDKHKKRHENTGFIIQTQDMIRSDKLETSVVDPSTLKLKTLLTELDNFTFEIKKALMTASKEKDSNLNYLDEEELLYNAHSHLQKGNTIHAAAYLMMAEKMNNINKRLSEIKKIKDDQKKVYKESK